MSPPGWWWRRFFRLPYRPHVWFSTGRLPGGRFQFRYGRARIPERLGRWLLGWPK